MALPPRNMRPANGVNGMYGGRPEYYQGRPHHSYPNGRYPFDFGFLAGKGFLPDYPTSLSGKNPIQKTVEYEYEEEDGHDGRAVEEEHDGKKLLVDHNRVDCDKTCEDEQILCYRGCICIKEEQR